ncbi:copper amine oxidase N-terminal domain-containing protein [Paenibacillus periandrae]|uniref:copper amine oxidase N-terminal domain-containing protein n=1 Tax=Paenibacillus periandrae TaxID=1761741 RepID=UPI001F092933|nr:copper amine oxidase N-terminal domain-containing protein [Paenibacillus periandrae]
MKLLKSKLALLVLCMALMLPTLVAGAAPASNSIAAASDLRVGLGQLLGEHALLAVLAMQKNYDKAVDYSDTANLLSKNTDQLAAAIASVYGPDAGVTFKSIWSSHIGYLIEYVNATAIKDEAGRAAAVAKLDDYRAKQAAFFAVANPDNFKAPAIEEGLNMHIGHLIDSFNAYVNKDYADAYTKARMAYSHMYDTADMLAIGVAAQYPDRFSNSSIQSTTVDLRGTLGQVLGEHALLAIVAMQKGIDAKPDFDQAAAALGQNTDDLAAAIAVIYGQDAADTFKPLWASHIGYLFDYVKATAAKDYLSAKQAMDNLDVYRESQAQFFAKVNPEFFLEADISKSLKEHINFLLTVFDTYAKNDYSFTYPNVEMAYTHMYKTADALAIGIAAHLPAMFPQVQPPIVTNSVVTFTINSTELDVNGHKLTMDVTPLRKENYTYIPLRYAVDAVGATLNWNEADRSATVAWNGNSATFSLGSDFVIHNSTKKVASAPLTLQGDRLVVPVQIFAEVIGWTVDLAEEGKVIRLLAP